MTVLSTYAKEVHDKGIPILGMLSWYSVSDDARVDCHDMRKTIEAHDAPMKPPAIPKPADVFRRACNDAQVKKARTDKPNEFVNYNLQDAGYDESFVYRIIVAERVDAREHALGYQVLTKVIFDKVSHKVIFEPVPDEATGVAPDLTLYPYHDTICNSIVSSIVDMNLLSTYSIRTTITSGYANLNSISARRGGTVYFVSNKHVAGLQAMESVIKNFDDVDVHMVPLIDDRKQSAMIRQAFEDESLGATQALMTELAELQKQDGPISGKRYTDLKVRHSELTSKLKDFQEILGDKLSDSEMTLNIANAQIGALLAKSLE